jgi:hypothetical protein
MCMDLSFVRKHGDEQNEFDEKETDDRRFMAFATTERYGGNRHILASCDTEKMSVLSQSSGCRHSSRDWNGIQ